MTSDIRPNMHCVFLCRAASANQYSTYRRDFSLVSGVVHVIGRLWTTTGRDAVDQLDELKRRHGRHSEPQAQQPTDARQQ